MEFVSRALIDRCSDITPLALQKMLYYVQGFYYAFSNSFLFKDNCEAWVHGPVYKLIYDKYSKYKYNVIDECCDFSKDSINHINESIIDGVVYGFGCYSGKTLESITHTEDPWINARIGLDESENSNVVITHDDIGSYFKKIMLEYNMKTPNDIDLYARSMFERVGKIRR